MASHPSRPLGTPGRGDAPGRVVGVLGASGGLGASTLTTALAVTAAQAWAGAAPVVAVDGRPDGGGLDVTGCVEHLPGLRWPDLAGVRGEVCGSDLLAELPRLGGARLLSAAAGRPPGAAVPSGEVLSTVVGALRSVTGLVVVDLPVGAWSAVGSERRDSTGAHRDPGGKRRPPFLAHCDAVVLLAGVSPRHLSDAVAARAALRAAVPAAVTGLVVRASGRGGVALAMADHLDLPLLAGWRDDAAVQREAERGRTPGESRRSSLAAVCGDVLAWAAADRWAA